MPDFYKLLDRYGVRIAAFALLPFLLTRPIRILAIPVGDSVLAARQGPKSEIRFKMSQKGLFHRAERTSRGLSAPALP